MSVPAKREAADSELLALRRCSGASRRSRLGNLAACRFYEGDVVIATLRFSTHEYQGQTFQEILATDIVKLDR